MPIFLRKVGNFCISKSAEAVRKMVKQFQIIASPQRRNKQHMVHSMDRDARKPVFGGVRTAKAQISLRIGAV